MRSDMAHEEPRKYPLAPHRPDSCIGLGFGLRPGHRLVPQLADFQNLLDNLLPCPLDTEGENAIGIKRAAGQGFVYTRVRFLRVKGFPSDVGFSCNCLRSSDRQSGW